MQYILKILAIVIALSFSVSGYAKDKNEKGQHKGPDTSVEHKSEAGLEHGEAYAGTKEKKEKEEKVKEDKDKEKKEKEDKDKEKKEKEDKDKKEGKDKKEKKSKKGK